MLLRSSLYGETNEIVGEFMKRYSLIKLDIICHTVVNIYMRPSTVVSKSQ